MCLLVIIKFYSNYFSSLLLRSEGHNVHPCLSYLFSSWAAITQEDLSINQICCSSITRGLHRLTEYDYIAIAGGLLHHYYARQHDSKNWRVIVHITGVYGCCEDRKHLVCRARSKSDIASILLGIIENQFVITKLRNKSSKLYVINGIHVSLTKQKFEKKHKNFFTFSLLKNLVYPVTQSNLS